MDMEELIGRVADGWERYRRSNAERIGAALATGVALLGLRERLAHGEFLPAVARLGIPERTARDWMRLARAGFKTATVADLGGIRAALESLRERPQNGNIAVLPGESEADALRRRELETDNAELQRLLGERLAVATPDTLEQFAKLARAQGEVSTARESMNELITGNAALDREIQHRRNGIEELQAQIEERRN